MDIGGREIPANNQSHVVEHPTQHATVNPTPIEETFFTDLSLLRLRTYPKIQNQLFSYRSEGRQPRSNLYLVGQTDL